MNQSSSQYGEEGGEAQPHEVVIVESDEELEAQPMELYGCAGGDEEHFASEKPADIPNDDEGGAASDDSEAERISALYPSAASHGRMAMRHRTSNVNEASVGGGPASTTHTYAELVRAALGHDTYLIRGGGNANEIPLQRPQVDIGRATPRRLLAPPLQSLADAVAPRRVIIECGGDGQCGPNSLAFMLGLLNMFNGDGFALRRQIVQYVKATNVLEHKTEFYWTLQPDSALTCRDLMVENMKRWPTEVLAGRSLTVEVWCEITAAAEAWTDITFVQLCASKFQVMINLVGVKGTGEIVPGFPINPTPGGTKPLASCDLGCWLNTHFVAIVDVIPPERAIGGNVATTVSTQIQPRGGLSPTTEEAPSLNATSNSAPGTSSMNSSSDKTTLSPSSLVLNLQVPSSYAVDLRVAAQCTAVLIYITILAQPLLFAHINGFSTLGVQFPSAPKRSVATKSIQRLCDQMWNYKLYTFMVGLHSMGWQLFTAPAHFTPPEAAICRTRAQRLRWLAAGVGFAWCTLAAVSGTPVGEAASQAFLAAQCFMDAPSTLSGPPGGQHALFSVGATHTTSMLGVPSLCYANSPSAQSALQRMHAQDTRLKDLLLSAVEHAPELDGWLERIRPAPLEEIPDSLITRLPDFTDPALSLVELPAAPLPYQLPWMALPPLQRLPGPDTPFCPRIQDLITPGAQNAMQRWLQHQLSDLIELRRQLAEGVQPEQVKRNRPAAIALGQSEVVAWARGIIWDCRQPCCSPLDFAAPFSSDLNLRVLKEQLGCYPDQALLSYLLEGVRLEANVELQAVFVPHLASLSLGLASVDREIHRLQKAGWYDVFDDLPFFPIYLNGQGAVARKLEPDRFRRSTEGGGPRKETVDASGLRAISINEAARTPHVPQYFKEDPRPEFQQWFEESKNTQLQPNIARQAPWCQAPAILLDPKHSMPPIPNPKSKACKERKPTLATLMLALAVLCRAAHVLDAPIYVFSDDVKDYFNQLGMASSELWKLGIAFLEDLNAPPDKARLVFVSEKRLGFGTHTASNTAQRFSDALLALFADRMDEVEALHHPGSEHANWPLWEADRQEVQKRSNQSCHTTRRYAASLDEQRKGIPVCPQSRLWYALMYTDDPIFIVVGASRAVRALQTWRALTQEMQLIMAIPEKRVLGSWAAWLGIIIIAPLGIIVVPRHKLIRAASTITQVLNHGCAFHIYRSLCGLLEHLRAINLSKKNVMHGLYAPHQADGVSRFGPNATVRCDALMRQQLQRWRTLAFRSGGVDVREAIAARAKAPSTPITVILDSDACHGDEEPSGLGGYMHGYFWYFKVPVDDYPFVNTPLLEFIAVCFNILTFYHMVQTHEGTILLRTDALTTALTLPSANMKSVALITAYQSISSTTPWKKMAARLAIRHLFGDSNVMADAVSRGRWKEFSRRCSQLGIQPQQISISEEAHTLYRHIVDAIKQQRLQVVSFAGFRAGGDDHLSHLVIRKASRRLFSEPAQDIETTTTHVQTDTDMLIHLVRSPNHAPVKSPRAPANTRAMLPEPRRQNLQGIQFPPGLHSNYENKRPLLTAAGKHFAASMAENFTQGEGGMQFGLAPAQIAVLTCAIQEGIEYGVNANTGDIDERAWRMWVHVCAQYNTSPYRTATEVQQNPQRNSHLMAALMMHAFSMGKPKDATRQFIRPRSALAYPLAIVRIFKRWSIIMPPQSMLKSSLAHLSRLYIAYHGPYSLAPRRAEPMKYSMVLKMGAIDEVAVGPIWWADTDHNVFMFKRLNLILWPTGFRLAEIVQHSSQETMYLTFESLSWNIAGRIVAQPTEVELLHLVAGEDYARLAPPRSKPDQWGEIHCPYPVVLTYFLEPGNAAAALRDIELRRLHYDPKPARAHLALIHDASYRPYTHAFLHSMLKAVLTHCYGKAVASLYTWHSYRSGLATALHAAGVEDSMIMLICRWMSPESLHVYRRMGTEENERCTRKAMLAKVDLLQSNNVPKVMGDHGYAQLFAEFKTFNALDNAVGTTQLQVDAVVQRTLAGQAPPTTVGLAVDNEESPATRTRRTAAKKTKPNAGKRRRAPPAPPPTLTPEERRQLPLSDVRHQFPPTLEEIVEYNERRPIFRPPPRDRHGAVNRDA